MSYYKIKKLEAIDSVFTDTAIGYIDSDSDKSTFEGIHGFVFTEWASNNSDKSLDVYFETNDPCYVLDTSIELPVGLSLITNLENPES